jgi:hypothetical protein
MPSEVIRQVKEHPIFKETRLTSDCAYQGDLFSRSLEQPEEPDLSVDRQSIFLQPSNQVSDPVFQHARMLQLKSRQRQRGLEFGELTDPWRERDALDCLDPTYECRPRQYQGLST